MKLTICSVYFSKEQIKMLQKNILLVKKLNDNAQYEWMIANNSPDLTVVFGKKVDVMYGADYPKKIPSAFRGSYHHGQALNLLIRKIKTRFVCILDPDFYIVRKNFINEILCYMEKNNLAFFGAPWHPKWYNKIRHFPASHCIFIDLNKVPKEKIDFRPDYTKNELANIQKNIYPLLFNFHPQHITLSYIKKRLVLFLKAILLFDRKIISSSKDTGFRLYIYALKKGLKYEALKPVYKLSQDFLQPKYALSGLNLFIERFLPDGMCYIPKDRAYFTQIGYKAGAREQFLWKDKVFGFHIRGKSKEMFKKLTK